MKPTHKATSSGKSPNRRRRVVRLPSLKTLQGYTLKQVERAFVKWLKTQDPNRTYNYGDIYGCPLARFGQAVTRDKSVTAGGWKFSSSLDSWIIKIGERLSKALHEGKHGTYGDLIKALS